MSNKKHQYQNNNNTREKKDNAERFGDDGARFMNLWTNPIDAVAFEGRWRDEEMAEKGGCRGPQDYVGLSTIGIGGLPAPPTKPKMSKITPKNLQYDGTLPPFLARLQSANASSDGRHEYTVARPKKARNPEDEAEDEPVYFDEGTGETLTKKEWEEKEAEDEAKAEEPARDGENADLKDGGEAKESKEKVAAIGASKKRKVGKIVGADEGDDERDTGIKAKITSDQSKTLKTDAKAQKSDTSKIKSKTAKKGKKIKLSFGDDE
ncbi:hypothetical protein G7Y89_g9425 [Cudoniella acicularis]|uniref:DUF4604 domain-containing protein n=1 Tax=Cudoniella acicularis TaxID=354080 RepID=A0A8H4VZM8_9HELO|nr:hypothetical protein G7Y89_g9425 [Cudoniella acicularis]